VRLDLGSEGAQATKVQIARKLLYSETGVVFGRRATNTQKKGMLTANLQKEVLTSRGTRRLWNAVSSSSASRHAGVQSDVEKKSATATSQTFSSKEGQCSSPPVPSSTPASDLSLSLRSGSAATDAILEPRVPIVKMNPEPPGPRRHPSPCDDSLASLQAATIRALVDNHFLPAIGHEG